MKTFAALLEEYFQDTAMAAGIEERHFRIAGREVALRFCGSRWTGEMTGALAHLSSKDATRADLTVSMWDGSSQPRNHLLRAYLFTLTNWWFDYTGKRGELLDLHGDGIDAAYHPDLGILSVLDHANNRGFYWKRDASPMAYYESCSPFRSLLHAWMRTQQAFFVHGAAIGNTRGGVLLVGKGGSGKSTTTLACLRSPLPLQAAGDDYCILANDAFAGLRAHSLYSTAKLVEMRNLDAFPEMSGSILNPVQMPGEKVALSLAGYVGSRLVDSVPVSALLVPVITGAAETSLERCSAKEALIALAPSTLSQLPFSGGSDLRFLGGLTRDVPCYRIRLGTDLEGVAQAIHDLINSFYRAPLRTDSPNSETTRNEAPLAPAAR